jgi:hypothetical protein
VSLPSNNPPQNNSNITVIRDDHMSIVLIFLISSDVNIKKQVVDINTVNSKYVIDLEIELDGYMDQIQEKNDNNA